MLVSCQRSSPMPKQVWNGAGSWLDYLFFKNGFRYGTIYNTMAKFEKRLDARKLRRKGYSIFSIARCLGVSKSSVSVWCRDLKLTQKQANRLLENAINAGHKGRMIGAEMNRRKKEERIAFHKESGEKEIGKLSDRDLLMTGIALYWGEGNKKGKTKLSFANSDPEAILFMYKWFQKAMDVGKNEFMPRIFINEIHGSRIKKVVKFWSSLLNLPIEQFGKPFLLKMKQKKVYENHDNYYGVLALGVRKSTDLKYRILGLINALKNSNKEPV
jgi:hypothetical protein